jgi:hypothetical protein
MKTTEWDLHDLLRELIAQLLESAQRDFRTYADFLDAVREEEELTLWFGDEDPEGRGARFEILARYDTEAEAVGLDIVAEGQSAELYNLANGSVPPASGDWLAGLGAMNKKSLREIYTHMVKTGAMERFFYAVRTSLAE